MKIKEFKEKYKLDVIRALNLEQGKELNFFKSVAGFEYDFLTATNNFLILTDNYRLVAVKLEKIKDVDFKASYPLEVVDNLKNADELLILKDGHLVIRKADDVFVYSSLEDKGKKLPMFEEMLTDYDDNNCLYKGCFTEFMKTKNSYIWNKLMSKFTPNINCSYGKKGLKFIFSKESVKASLLIEENNIEIDISPKNWEYGSDNFNISLDGRFINLFFKFTNSKNKKYSVLMNGNKEKIIFRDDEKKFYYLIMPLNM